MYDLLLTKSEQKVIGNWFYAPKTLKNPLKPIFTKKYTFTICVGLIWIVIGYFLFKNETFNGLLKINGIQKTNSSE